jgi:hypothetical protein
MVPIGNQKSFPEVPVGQIPQIDAVLVRDDPQPVTHAFLIDKFAVR